MSLQWLVGTAAAGVLAWAGSILLLRGPSDSVRLASQTHDGKKRKARLGISAAPTSTLNVFIVRHAESNNNVIAEELASKYGKSPYVPGSVPYVEYESRRSSDPGLSPLGKVQAGNLPYHPLIQSVQLKEVAKHNRVKIFCSPTSRAVETSLPLAETCNVTVKVIPDLCENGGYYETREGKQYSARGRTRAELEKIYPGRHDFSSCGEDGWWHTNSPGFEEADEYEERVDRVIAWLRDMAWRHRVNHSLHPHRGGSTHSLPSGVDAGRVASQIASEAMGQSSADYVVLVTHGDFSNTLLTRLLRINDPPRYVFKMGNTCITHIELEFAPVSHWRLWRIDKKTHQQRQDALAKAKADYKGQEHNPDHHKFWVRVRQANAPPAASTPLESW